jgi:hypothetical protein
VGSERYGNTAEELPWERNRRQESNENNTNTTAIDKSRTASVRTEESPWEKNRTKKQSVQSNSSNNRTRIQPTPSTQIQPIYNWPKCRPIIYHDISKEIPVNSQGLVRRSYRLWLLMCIRYVMNMISCIALIAIRQAQVLDLVLSILYLFLAPPLMFYFIHLILYKAAKKDSSLLFFIFFVNDFIHILAAILLAIGITSSGGSGFIQMIRVFEAGQNTVGIICLINVLIVILEIFMNINLYYDAVAHFRGQGHTVEGAAREGGLAAARNPHVREAAIRSAV